jgi:starch phosphorylase
VSSVHGTVSRRLFSALVPRWPEAETPVTHVTNGVHVPSWDSAAADALRTRAGGKERWLRSVDELPEVVHRIPDAELWALRGDERRTLVAYVAMDKQVERHEAEFDRRFAREVAARTRGIVRELRVGRLVVAAAPRFLGVLRRELASTLPDGIALAEIVADLTWHTPSRIREALVRHELVRLNGLPEAAHRPKSQHPSTKRNGRAVQRRT